MAAALGQYVSQVAGITRHWESSAGRQDYLYSWPLPRTGLRKQGDGAGLLKYECLEAPWGLEQCGGSALKLGTLIRSAVSNFIPGWVEITVVWLEGGVAAQPDPREVLQQSAALPKKRQEALVLHLFRWCQCGGKGCCGLPLPVGK